MVKHPIQSLPMLEVKRELELMHRTKMNNIIHYQVHYPEKLDILMAEIILLEYVLFLINSRLEEVSNDARTTIE